MQATLSFLYFFKGSVCLWEKGAKERIKQKEFDRRWADNKVGEVSNPGHLCK